MNVYASSLHRHDQNAAPAPDPTPSSRVMKVTRPNSTGRAKQAVSKISNSATLLLSANHLTSASSVALSDDAASPSLGAASSARNGDGTASSRLSHAADGAESATEASSTIP